MIEVTPFFFKLFVSCLVASPALAVLFWCIAAGRLNREYDRQTEAEFQRVRDCKRRMTDDE